MSKGAYLGAFHCHDGRLKLVKSCLFSRHFLHPFFPPQNLLHSLLSSWKMLERKARTYLTILQAQARTEGSMMKVSPYSSNLPASRLRLPVADNHLSSDLQKCSPKVHFTL